MVVDDGRVHLQSKMVMSFPRNLEIVLSGPVAELPQLPSCRSCGLPNLPSCHSCSCQVAGLPQPQLQGCPSCSCRVAAVDQLPGCHRCSSGLPSCQVAGLPQPQLPGCHCCSCRCATSVGSPVAQLEVFLLLACLSTGSIHITVVSVVRRLACPSTR